jgi:hypothetical protein
MLLTRPILNKDNVTRTTSLRYSRQSLALSRQLREGIDLTELGIVYPHLGQLERALRYFQDGLAVPQGLTALSPGAILPPIMKPVTAVRPFIFSSPTHAAIAETVGPA